MSEGIVTIIKELLSSIGYTAFEVRELEIAGQTVYSIIPSGDAGDLIGPRGDTIHAIDTIVKKIVEARLGAKDGEESKAPLFLVDVNDYRTRQIKDLQAKALMMAERARSFQYDVELSPMSAYERLIVHTTLQGAPDVKTESEGEGRSRRVVIRYAA